MLGPLVGTALLSGDTTVPYLGSALLIACFAPVALWLARLETLTPRTVGPEHAGSS
jgi:hypothetical protein